MARGRQLKTQLRHYSPSTSTNNGTTTTDSYSTISVTEKLAKLRIEQSRAVTNRERQRQDNRVNTMSQPVVVLDQDTHQLHPWSLATSSSLYTPDSTAPSQRPAAGPPPPPSWTRSRQVPLPHIPTPSHQRMKPASISTPSLIQLCCRQLSELSSSPQFKHLPIHVKQQLLYEWSFMGANGSLVTDTTMDLFQKTDYEELWLEGSQVSLGRLIRAFWTVDIMTTSTDDNDLVDDWEDLQLDDTDDNVPRFMLLVDHQEDIGKWKDLYEIMIFLRPTTNPSTTTTYTLSSPYLGQTLVSLNISWMKSGDDDDDDGSSFSWLTFSYLMVSTLPHLMWLYSAGCFNRIQGPQVVSILSHGMRKLKFWDLAYYDDWLMPTEAVDWHRDLLELKTLCLSASHKDQVDISNWYKEQHLSRIKLIWIE